MANAKLAMSQTLHEMADSLKDAADPRAWTAQYPWVSLGAAAAVGFLLASAVTPSRDETLAQRLKSLMPETPAEPVAPQAPGYAAPPPPKPSKASMIIGPLMDAVKTALVGAISSAVTAKAHQNGDQQPQEDVPQPHAYSEPVHGPTEPL